MDQINTSSSGYAKNDFVVRFSDECIDSKITAPVVSSYDVPLYTLDARGFSPSQNNKLNCADIYYVLNWPAGNPNSPTFSLDKYNQIVVEPKLYKNLG